MLPSSVSYFTHTQTPDCLSVAPVDYKSQKFLYNSRHVLSHFQESYESLLYSIAGMNSPFLAESPLGSQHMPARRFFQQLMCKKLGACVSGLKLGTCVWCVRSLLNGAGMDGVTIWKERSRSCLVPQRKSFPPISKKGIMIPLSRHTLEM